jgi:hypothetical protein
MNAHRGVPIFPEEGRPGLFFAFGKPRPAVEEKDDMDAQIASMSREQRFALMRELLEPMRKYLPPGKDPGADGRRRRGGPRPDPFPEGRPGDT